MGKSEAASTFHSLFRKYGYQPFTRRMITIRPFQSDDFNTLLKLANQAVPFDPDGNEEWLAYRKSFDEDVFFRYHCIAEEDAESVGYGCLEQQSEDASWLRVFVVCHPEKLNGAVGRQVFDHLLMKARKTSATHLWAREYQNRPGRGRILQ